YDARYSRLGEGMAAPRWSPAPRRGRKRGAVCGGGKSRLYLRAVVYETVEEDDGREQAAGDNDGDKARLDHLEFSQIRSAASATFCLLLSHTRDYGYEVAPRIVSRRWWRRRWRIGRGREGRTCI
ncbi:hypothetical protein ALC62_10967, partial [Cyphomyrmex costatus]